jgi:hypothetical protein
MNITKKIDSKGRLNLGEAFSNKTVIIEERGNGELIIKEAVVIPANEKWLFENKDALNLVTQGIREARSKKFVNDPRTTSDDSWINELEDS